jgi:ubiquinone/menaquinone biosynthesis C-methylase UbiE
MATDLKTIKQTQQQVWPTGDYQVVINHMNLASMSERLCDATPVLPTHRVLDIATGTGNTALSAKRRGFPHVTGIDYAPGLLEIAKARAKAEQLDVTLEEADAEDLPYPADSFDVVLSTCGVIFAPDQKKAAEEMVRVCRPGGRIGFTAWTPDGDIGTFNKTIASYVPPPPDAPSPMKWGTTEGVEELLADRVDLEITERELAFPVRSAEYYIDLMLENFGPAMAAFNKLDESSRQDLRRDLIAIFESRGRTVDGALVVPGQHLEVVGTVR